MTYSRTTYFGLLAAFFLTIGYSLVLNSDVVNGNGLESIGIRIVAQYALASVLMLVIWHGGRRLGDTLSSVFVLLVVGISARLILLAVDPYTSNDVARYLFDGRIAFEGLDPYQVPHDAPQLVTLREQWAPPAEHAKYVTLYPPLALSIFSFAASFGQDAAIWVWKVFTTFASVAVLLLAYKILQRQNKLQHLPLVALSPLLILEAGEGMHLDIITALAVLTAIFFWQSKRLVMVGVCIATGGLLKVLPMVLLLPLFIMLNRWKDRLVLVVVTLSVWLGVYAAAFYLGFRPIGSVAVFFEKWRSGSALFLWLEPHLSTTDMTVTVLGLMSFGFLSVSAYLYRSKRLAHQSKNARQTQLDSALLLSMQLVLAIPLLVSPVIFPWYIVPIMALLALRPNLLMISWSLSIPLLYQVLGQFICCGVWAPANWPVHIIGLSVLVSLMIMFASSRPWMLIPKLTQPLRRSPETRMV